jgi:hypothetical protein
MRCATELWDFHALHYITLECERLYNAETYIFHFIYASIQISEPHDSSTQNN